MRLAPRSCHKDLSLGKDDTIRGSRCSLELSLVTGFPLSSVWVPFGFPRKKWVPFINMHNGRVNDVIYCYNLGFLHTNEVSS